MDRFLVRKDVYEELEKAMRDRSHLVQKDITDKNGNRRKVWVRGNVQQKEQKTVKGEEATEETKNIVDSAIQTINDKLGVNIPKEAIEQKDENSVIIDWKKLGSNRSYPGEKESAFRRRVMQQENKDWDGNKPFEIKNMASKLVSVITMNPTNNGDGKTSKYSAGDSVNLDGAKGDFKIQSIDKDGAYHVVSADGKKGYKVSENHITGKTEEKEIEFEKKNNASKSEEITRKNDAENNVKEAIKLTESEKNEIFKTLENPDFMSTLDKEQNSTTIGNIILNNLYSSGKEDLFNKIRKQEWDYKNANDKHGNTFNSDYAKEAMYQLYQEYKNNPKQTENKEPEKQKKLDQKKEVSVQVKMKRKEQQKKEKEKYDYNKRMNDFYVNTGLDGGPEAVLYRQAVEKEENKQPNLRAGSRDDSIFEENDDVQFWRSGNYIDGKITQVKESYDGSVSLQVESNGNKYWVETENIIKHPASAK